MSGKSYELHGVRVYECAAKGVQPRADRDAIDLISAAWEHRARFLVIPVERLGDDFFHLKTRIAGEIIQKFLTYGLRVAIIGDIGRYVSESASLRAFVSECNRGPHVWFLPHVEELNRRLQRPSQG